jgi:uncharacterized membrane protein
MTVKAHVGEVLGKLPQRVTDKRTMLSRQDHLRRNHPIDQTCPCISNLTHAERIFIHGCGRVGARARREEARKTIIIKKKAKLNI